MREFMRAAIVLLAMAAAAPAVAADMFLVIEGVTGGSVDSQFRGSINVRSYNLGHDWAAGATRATFKPLQVTKGLDISSPTLAVMAGTGQLIKSATLSVRVSTALGAAVVHTIVLREASLRGFSASANQDGEVSEQLALFYNRIEWTFVPVDAAGRTGTPVTTRWDVVNNRFY